jgi:hypothetical protein
MERVATKDDTLPLSNPIIRDDGSTINSLRIKKGQVYSMFLMYLEALLIFFSSYRLSLHLSSQSISRNQSGVKMPANGGLKDG